MAERLKRSHAIQTAVPALNSSALDTFSFDSLESANQEPPLALVVVDNPEMNSENLTYKIQGQSVREERTKLTLSNLTKSDQT